MQLNLTHYTRDSYFKCFPKATENDWQEYLVSDEYEMKKKMEGKTGHTITQVRKVFIDEEYFGWLQENKKKNITENRLEYMNSCADKDVERLWRKYHEYDWSTYEYVVPFAIITVGRESVPKNTIEFSKAVLNRLQIELSKTVLNRLQNEIAKLCIVPKEDVLIHHELVRADEFMNEFEEKFESAADKFFVDGEYNLKVNFSSFAKKQEHKNFAFRFLPVSVKLENTAILNFNDLNREEKRNFSFTESFIGSISEDIEKQMGRQLTLVTGFKDPIIGSGIPEFIDEFVTGFINMENSKNVDLV